MRPAVRVLDTYSLIAYFEGEAGKDKMIEIFRTARDSEHPLLLSVINWGEIYYITMRTQGKDKAELFKTTLARYPITIVEANKELTLQAALYKATHKLSYADAFAAALAKNRKAVLVTGDKEFKSLEGEFKINWL